MALDADNGHPGSSDDELNQDPMDGESEHPVAGGRLLFWVQGARYTGALVALREALPAIPAVTPVPFSPPWLIGIFPLRTDLVTLIDPYPFLAADGGVGSVTLTGMSTLASQALLIGENGLLLGLVVDRVGDIIRADTYDMPASAPLLAESSGGADDDAPIALDLAALYIEVMSKLESWASHA